jgi:hypothetical protein
MHIVHLIWDRLEVSAAPCNLASDVTWEVWVRRLEAMVKGWKTGGAGGKVVEGERLEGKVMEGGGCWRRKAREEKAGGLDGRRKAESKGEWQLEGERL